MSKVMQGQYILLELPDTSPDSDEEITVLGVFQTVEEVKEYILEDAGENWAPETIEEGEDENYCSRYAICRVAQVLRPIPTVSVTWGLKRVKP